jgi:uncharacterized protein YdhG (YjbR/CyaY superfamily)
VVAAASVDRYIRAAPADARPALRKVRAAVREAAPDAEESISYGMPFYSYQGEVGVERRLCYFGIQRSYLRLFLRPKDLDPHAKKLVKFRTTKSALRFPLDQPLPLRLIQTIVRDADRRHRAGKAT